MKSWEVRYKGHQIRVENTLSHERLFVDGEFQDEQFGMGLRSRLFGKIRSADGAGEKVRVSLGGWFVQCRIFADDHLIYHSKPDGTASQAISESNR